MTRLTVLLLLVVPFFAAAHAGGASYEEVVGKYIVDIGYDPVAPRAEDRLVFDFNLWEAVASTTADFDYVWVRLEHEKKTLIATGIAKADFGPTSLLFLLPKDLAGDLTVSARYQSREQAIAEASFSIPIEPRSKEVSDYLPSAYGALLGALGAGLGAFFIRRFWKVVE